MKRTKIFVAVCGAGAILMLLHACQKGFGGLAQPKPLLMASSTNVATGQTVSLTVLNTPAATHDIWSSTPQANASLSVTGAQGAANVSFSKAGTYVITCGFASGAGADSVSYNDTAANPHDTIVYYPPPTPPQDRTSLPHDTVPNPGDTIPSPPHDTIVYNPPPPPPQDSTYRPADSTSHSNSGRPITNSVTIIITVH